MTYRVRNIVIALGLALVAAMLTMFYVTNYKRTVQHDEANVAVYVAARDVAAGVNGSDLASSKALVVEHVAKRTVVPGAISSPDQIDRLVLAQPLYKGEQVTLRRFTDVQAQGIRAQLKGTFRAVQVPGDPNQLLAGTLKVGDRVDLVGYLKSDTSRVVLRDLPVLQIGSGSSTPKVAADTGSVILKVSDTEVQRLFYVLKAADWTLELRPVVDAADSSERAENSRSVTRDGLSPTEWYHLQRGAH